MISRAAGGSVHEDLDATDHGPARDPTVEGGDVDVGWEPSAVLARGRATAAIGGGPKSPAGPP